MRAFVSHRLEQRCRAFFNGDFASAFFVIVFRAIDARTYGVLLHQPGIEGFQTIQNRLSVGHAGVKPALVIFLSQDCWHAIVNIGHKRVGPSCKDGAGFEDVVVGISPAVP